MIFLNDIIRLTDEEIEKTYIRFMIPSGNFNPVEDAKYKDKIDRINLVDLVYNRKKKNYFDKGIIAIGFIPLENDRWLFTGIVDIIKSNGLGKPAKAIYRDKKFNYRLVIKYHKSESNGIRKAKKKGFINKIEVLEIWDPNKSLNEKSFPGYRNVKVTYSELKNKLENSEEWKTALKCRKGIYLITDTNTGKLYVW